LSRWPRGGAGVVFALLVFWGAPATSQEPSIRNLRLDTEAVFDHLRAASGAARKAAILDLCCLHDRIVFHPQFPRYSKLVSLRAQTVSELREVVRELERDHSAAAGILASGTASDTDRGAAGEARLSPGEAQVIADWHARRGLRTSAQSTGGPAGWGYQVNGFFAPGDEQAAELINLIIQTINPDRWRTANGDATIAWWQPARVLVVSADMDTHDRLEALLIGLRGR
jgi:hypothetical protein